MKPHEKLGIAIANAGYTWTPEMRSAWEELDKQQQKIPAKEITKIYEKIYAEGHKNQVLALARAIEAKVRGEK